MLKQRNPRTAAALFIPISSSVAQYDCAHWATYTIGRN